MTKGAVSVPAHIRPVSATVRSVLILLFLRHGSETIESMALPIRPTESRTNFAGGELTACEWMGQSVLYRLNTGSVAIRSRCAS